MNREDTVLDRRTIADRSAGSGRTSRARLLELTRVELARTWPSYLITAISFLLFGLLGLTILSSGLAGETGDAGGISATFWVDYVFLLTAANLGMNWASLRWMTVHRDPFTIWLSFLRALPISVRELVLTRVLILLASTLIMALLFFLPFYALFGAIRAEIPTLQYLWFALFWIGYALFSGGALVYLEMGLVGRVTLLIQCLWTIALIALAVLVARLGDAPIVVGVLRLIDAYGPLPAVASLAVGGAGLYVWCRLLERRLETRELAS